MSFTIPEDTPRLYATEKIKLKDKTVYAAFGSKTGWVWLVVEYNPEDRICWGFVHGFEDEWGYFSLGEMEDLGDKIYQIGMEPTKFEDLQSWIRTIYEKS